MPWILAIYASYEEKDGRGQAAYDPAMMVRVLLYGDCMGSYSWRKIQAKTYEDIAFRYLAADERPDHSTLAEFRQRHLGALAGLFCQALQLCEKAGLVKLGHVAIDGSTHYLGPMPLTASQRYNADTRDEGRRERTAVTGAPNGVFRCHYAGECSRACPKGVDPAKALQFLKRCLVLDYLRLAGRTSPCKKLHGPGEGKLLPNIAAAPPKTVERGKSEQHGING